MTTVIRTRNPLETLSMNPEPQRRRSKRLASTCDLDETKGGKVAEANEAAAYDETDGDFAFTRKPKRSKVSLEPVAEGEAAPIHALRNRSQDNALQNEPANEAPKKPTRRKMDFSTPKKELEKAPAPPKETRTARKRSPPANIPAEEPKRTTRRTRASLVESNEEPGDHDDDAIEMVGAISDPTVKTPKPKAKSQRREPQRPVENSVHEPETHEITRTPISDASHAGTSKIALPFSDTPVIDRNKNMRKKDTKRRSSLGLRGRRASSLIDAGHTATPHTDVPTTEFYKHIEAENLTEPRRMKQLLTWCGERALGDKPAHGGDGSAAVLAARHIQEQLLSEFGTKSEMSDWFSREPTRKRVVLVKNPLNESNAARVAELEERIKRLKAEKASFKKLLKPPAPEPKPSSTGPINPSLLDAESQAILSQLQSTSSTLLPSISERLKKLQINLEFQTDVFAHGIHSLEQTREDMDALAQRVLEKSKERLEEREQGEKERMGTMEVPTMEILRALSRVMPGGSR